MSANPTFVHAPVQWCLGVTRSKPKKSVSLTFMKTILCRPLLLTAAILASVAIKVSAVPYASGITNAGGGVIRFVLNAAATSVTVKAEDGTPLTCTNLAGASSSGATGMATGGTNAFDLTGHTSFSITVSNNAVGGIIQISSDLKPMNSYFAPNGVTVNRNPKTGNFGRIYVVNGTPGNPGVVGNPRTTSTEGVYVMDANCNDIIGQGNLAAATGYTFGTATAASPSKPFVAADDMVYVSDNTAGTICSVWYANPNLTRWTNVFNLGSPSTVSTNYGRMYGTPNVTGSLASGNLILKGIMADTMLTNGGARVNLNGGNAFDDIATFNIGSGPIPFLTAPSMMVNPASIGSVNAVAQDLFVAPDGKMFIYVPRSTASDGNTNLTVLSSAGAVLWDSKNQSIAKFGGNTDFMVAGSGSGQVSVSLDNLYVVCGNPNAASVGNFKMLALTNGIPDISTIYTNLVGAGGGGTDRGAFIDAANNIYVNSGGSDTMRILTMGGSSVAVTTNDSTVANGAFSLMGVHLFTNSTALAGGINIVTPGGTVKFRAYPDGKIPDSYQWYKNGVALTDGGIVSGSTTSNLTLTGVQASDVASYTVSATFGATVVGPTLDCALFDLVNTPLPVTQSVGPGTNVSFAANVTGPGPFTYKWSKNGTVIAGSTANGLIYGTSTNAATLTINNSGTAQAGSYSVAVTRAGSGTVTSASGILVVDTPPTISIQPHDAHVSPGDTTNMTVTASGGELSYQWRKNGSPISNGPLGGGTVVSGATTSALTFTGAAIADSDTYSCVITNVAGQITSSGAVLAVADAPYIDVQPVSKVIGVGTNATFSVVAKGSPTLSYTWSVDKGSGPVVLSDTGNITGSATATLTVATISHSDEGTYSVVVANNVSSATSSSVTLTGVDAPVVTTPPQNTSVAAGTTGSFTVSISGSTFPAANLAYKWRKNGTIIPGSSGAKYGTSTNTANLTVLNAATTDVASYDVIITNIAGSVTSASGLLTVDVTPVVTTPPANATVGFGLNTNFTVSATGGELHYQWQRNNVNVTDDAHNSGSTTTNLTIINADDATQNGTYTVIINNLAGTITSASATLTVAVDPVITTQPQNQSAATGSQKIFTVVAQGKPTLTYAWYKGATPLSDGGVYSGTGTASLTLTGVTTSDNGGYSVVVGNNFDAFTVTSSTATLTVFDLPVISPDPVSSTYMNGDTVVLHSGTTSGTSPVYKWKKGAAFLSNGATGNGSTIAGATTTDLTVSTVQLSDQGSYTMVASNFAGAVTSGSATVVVYKTPSITGQPQDKTVNGVGASATFTVTADGNPLSYQWRFNGANIANATDSSYTIPSVNTTDIGYYSVVVSNFINSVTSSSAKLQIGILYFVDSLENDTSANWITNVPADDTTGHARATWAFDYSTRGIPQAPGSSSTRALKLEANIPPLFAQKNGISCSPALNSYITNLKTNTEYQLRFKVWMNVVGPSAGGTGSTEFFVGAVNTSGNFCEWPQTSVNSDGIYLCADGEGGVASGNTLDPDYGIYTNRNNAANPPLVGTAGGNYAAGTGSDATDNTNSYYISAFPAKSPPAAQATYADGATQTGAAPAGTLAYAWHEVIAQKKTVSATNATVTFSIDGVVIGSVTNAQFPVNGTNVAIGYNDLFSSQAATNWQFGLFTDVRVESFSGSGVAPTVTTQPVTQTVQAGSSPVLTVGASSPTTLRYQWQKNGANIAGATSSSLTLANVLAQNAGSYQALVFNDTAPATSSTAVLTVVDPGILTQPVSSTVIIGTTANFSVIAGGTGSLTYQWRKAGNPLSNGGNVSGATTSALTLANTVVPDSDTYDVVVTGTIGSTTSSPATLTVQDPGFISQPVSLTRNAGQDAIYSISAGGTGTLTYQWYAGAGALTDSAHITGSTTTSLTVHSVATADEALYSCVVTGTAGSATSSQASLTVINPPVISTQPNSATKNARTTVTFTVAATGTAPFTYQWRKNGANLTASSKIIGVTSAVLTITNVLAADAASYSAVVSNPAGSPTSSDAILTVVDPLITSQPAGRTNNLGDNANFSVTADGTSPFTYQWQFNGVNISGATATAYIRGNVTAADAGSYRVIVSGVGGSTTSTDAPLAILYPAATKIAQWNFNSAANDGDTTTGTLNPSIGSGTVVGLNGVTTVRFNRGTGSDPAEVVAPQDNSGLSSSNYTAQAVSNKTAGVKFSVSTVGYTNLAITWEQLNQANSSKYTRLQYSTDGGANWTDGPSITTTQNSAFTFHYADLSGVSAAENNPNFTFRMVSEFESTAIGNANANYVGTTSTYSPSGTGGLLRYDMVTLLGSVAPEITSDPSSLTKELGDTANFSVGASGASLSYQWQKGGVNLSNGGNVAGATTSALTLSNVAGPDDGSYRCIVSNIEGSATSADATLLVHDPAIAVQPASATTECDTAGTLTVTATGTGPFTYQWYTPDANGTAVSGATSSVLSISSVHGSIPYVVVVSSIYGSATSSSASLVAQDTTPPVVTLIAGSNAVVTGGSYNDPGATASDTCDGSLGVTTNGIVDTSVAGYYTLTYIATDAGSNVGSATRVVHVADAVLNVHITSSLTNFTKLPQGTNVLLTAVSDGSDPKTYQWYNVAAGITNSIPNETNMTLQFAAQPVNGSTNVSYYVVVDNDASLPQPSTNVNITIVKDTKTPNLFLKTPVKLSTAVAPFAGIYGASPVSPGKPWAITGLATDTNSATQKGNIAHVYYYFISSNAPSPIISAQYEAVITNKTVGKEDIKGFNITTNIPPAGTNVLVIWAVDLAGNVSKPVTNLFFYQVQTPVTLHKRGDGTGKVTVANKLGDKVTPPFFLAGDSDPVVNMMIGEAYTLTYTPDRVTKNTNVTSSLTNAPGMGSGTNTIKKYTGPTIVVEPTTADSVTFEFDRDRFYDMFGNYNAVFTADSTLATSRYLQMTVKTNRLVTGYLKDTSTVKDLFPTTIIPANGHIDMTSAGGVHVVADLAWDGSEVSNGVKQVTGNVTIATLTTGLVADREDTKALPTKGLATMSIPGVSGNPGGNGFATLSLSGGKVTANYTLGDNDKQTVTWGLNGSRSGTIPQWVVTKTGVLFGNLNVNDGLTNLSASSLTWIRNTAGTTYPSLLPAGFTNSSFAAICSPYDKNVSQTGPFLITLSGGTLPNDVTQTVSLPFTSTTGPITSASVTTTNGIIKVTFFDGKVVGTSKKKTTAQGVVLQNATNGFGFFVCTNFSAPTNSGSLILTPQ